MDAPSAGVDYMLPFGLVESIDPDHIDFVNGFLAPAFERVRGAVGSAYPDVFAILGNDDPRIEEAAMLDVATRGLWHYAHDRRIEWRGCTVFGYACIPPTPFRLKDWERYDVSRYVDPGCSSPEEGMRTVPVNESEVRYGTIQQDLEELVGDRPLDRAIMLFHSPPYKSALDRAALDGRMVDHVPVDVHIGSIAVRRLVEVRQPWLVLPWLALVAIHAWAARREARVLERAFGDAYREYRANTWW